MHHTLEKSKLCIEFGFSLSYTYNLYSMYIVQVLNFTITMLKLYQQLFD